MLQLVAPFLAVCILLATSIALAQTKTIVSEATYLMGDGETPSFAENMVLQRAKQVALEQAGTYVATYTQTQNFDLTADEITTIAGGVMQTEVLERKRSLDGKGVHFFIKIKAFVTTENVDNIARQKQLSTLTLENKYIRSEVSRLIVDLEELQRQVLRSKTESEREIAIERIRSVERQFTQIQSKEAVLYRRLLSGDELSASVDNAIREMEHRQELERIRIAEQKHAFEQFISILKHNGHSINIGPPVPEVTLENPDKVTLRFHITVAVSSEAKQALRTLKDAYGSYEPLAADLRRIDDVLDRLELRVTVHLSDGTKYESLEKGVHNFRSAQSYDMKLMLRESSTQVLMKIILPRNVVSQIASVEGVIRPPDDEAVNF